MLGTLGSARTKIRFFPPSGLPVCVFARKGCVVCPGSAFEMTPRITQQKNHQKSVYSAKVSAEAKPCKPRSPKRVDLDEENKYTRLRGPRLPATRTTETLPYRSSFALKASKRARSVLIRAPVRVRVVRVRALECGAAVEQRVDQAALHDAHAAAAWMGSGSGAARSVTFQSSGTALFGPSQRRGPLLSGPVACPGQPP